MHRLKGFLCVMLWAISIQQLSAQNQQTAKLGLTDLFQLADENNRELKILDNNLKIAETAVKVEKNKLLPSLDASLTFSYNGDGWITDRDFSNGFSAPIPDFGNNFALEAKQIIYAGGAIKTAVEMAKRNQDLSQLTKDKVRQNIRFGIAGYYLEIIKLGNQKQIIGKNIAQTQKMIAQIKAKTNQGLALKNNITRFELQLQSYNLGLLKITNTITILNNELVKMLQLPIGTILELHSEDQAVAELQMTSGDSWKTLATNNSPLIKETQLQTEQAKSGEKLVKTDNLPQIFAFAGDYLNGPIMIEIPVIDKNFNYWFAGVGIKYNIASLYKTKNKLKAAQLSTQNSLENQDIVKEQLANDVQAAYIRYLETLDVYKTQLKSVDLAQQNYTVVKNRYDNDLVLITEMLDAENAKLDAELQATNAKINIIFHYYQLKKLSGTL